MAKNTSPVNKTINRNSTEAKRAKNEEASIRTSARKRSNGRAQTASKSSSKKKTQKMTASKPLSLKQQLAQRKAELEVINSIQQGLATKLDFPSIIDLIGEQIRLTTKAESVFIALYDKSSGLVSWPYWVTNGERIPDSIEPLKKNITRRVLFATTPLNLGTEGEILATDAIPT